MELLIYFWILGSWAFACAVYDLYQRRIPNYLTLGAHVIAILILVVYGRGWLGDSIASCTAAWGVGMLLTLPAYLVKLLGAGDVKMLAAIGLLVGLENLLLTYVVASFVMAGMAVSYKLSEFMKQQFREEDTGQLPDKLKQRVLPFGFGFSAGLLSVLFLQS